MTYQRSTLPTKGVMRRSTRVASTIAKKAAQQKVQFTPKTSEGSAPRAFYPAEMEESEKAHLPQPFLHDLPTSSLEPGTTTLDHPPSHVFPEPPVEETTTLSRQWIHGETYIF